jgi:MoxR-like ATPase
MTQIAEMLERIRTQSQRVVLGLDDAVDHLLVALLCEGHVILEGVPGTGKTLLARTFARSLGLAFKRVQFTPDLMPADIIGTNIFNFQSNEFIMRKGPVFTEFLLADEINRTPPKTQAALLEAMQERSVTIDGTSYKLSPLFLVVATQNPIEQEGTYPLPEAQLDRFLLQIDVSYPDADAERQMLFATTGTEQRKLKTILTAEELMGAQRLVRQLPVGDQVVDAILQLVRSARPGTGIDQTLDEMIAWGPGPRASQALMLAVRAKAMMEGRLAPSVDDVIDLAEPVLKHRMSLTFAARAEGIEMSDMMARLIEPLK